jgi:hypothetical protein
MKRLDEHKLKLAYLLCVLATSIAVGLHGLASTPVNFGKHRVAMESLPE